MSGNIRGTIQEKNHIGVPTVASVLSMLCKGKDIIVRIPFKH